MDSFDQDISAQFSARASVACAGQPASSRVSAKAAREPDSEDVPAASGSGVE